MTSGPLLSTVPHGKTLTVKSRGGPCPVLLSAIVPIAHQELLHEVLHSALRRLPVEKGRAVQAALSPETFSN